MGFEKMKGPAVAIVTLGAIVLTGLAVITGFKNTNLVNNATADAFVTGLTYFGTFAGVIVLAYVGKIIIGIFRKGGD